MSSKNNLKQTNVKNMNVSSTKIKMSHYEGLLPTPEIIETYEKLHPLLISILLIGFIIAFYKNNYSILGVGVLTTLIGALTKIFNKK